ncbi:hypothetical protein [Engelhardtia mirabilis]|uniref:Uncharacterized protein n=1 Tax=Engelhardtia mirabilis TaxID=2528011 RepID=A0A518BRG9_9BACT|nr:hypothetical protein Pla133_46880 [Planctomycetes bacterium Pla133]QDV03894.1 hypothetical protein Pla86_46860 [Planctomycetes bacterium Pla86]
MTKERNEEPHEPDSDGSAANAESPEVPGKGRRDFLRAVLGLGLANVTISFLGAVPAAASVQGGAADGDCAIPNDDGFYSKDTACKVGVHGPDLDCGKQSAEGIYHQDDYCATFLGDGQGFASDADCAKQGEEGVLQTDMDCRLVAPGFPEVKQRDSMCGHPVSPNPNGPTFRDEVCNTAPNGFQTIKDASCGKPKAPSGTYADDSCTKPDGIGFCNDSNCAKPNGPTIFADQDCGTPLLLDMVHRDDDCSQPIPGGVSQDDDCGKVDVTGGGFLPPLLHKDDDCGLTGNDG